MTNIGTGTSVRTSAPTLAVLAAAAVTAVVWAASASPASDTQSAALTSTSVDRSRAALVDTGPDMPTAALPRPVPDALAEDLRGLRSLDPGQQRDEAQRIIQDLLAGEYGARAQSRAIEVQRRLQVQPTTQQLRDDLRQLRGLQGEKLTDARREIREKALDGTYGDRVEELVERRAQRWGKQD